MCNRKIQNHSLRNAFTLLELLLVIALIAMLAGLIFPTIETLRKQAESTACASNLRQIGLAVLQKVQDNGNIFPYVEGDPTSPFYSPEKGAVSLAETLKPYGITDKALRCVSDVKANNNFASKGSSYEWFAFIDGENAANPKIDLTSQGAGVLQLPLWRFPLAYDIDYVHFGKRINIVYADAHVESLTGMSVLDSVKRVLDGTP